MWVCVCVCVVCVIYKYAPSKNFFHAVLKIKVTYFLTIKGKGKVHPRTGYEGPDWVYRYISTLSLTSALDGVGGQHHAPAALPPVKRPVTHFTEACVGPRVGLDGCGKSRSHRYSIPDRPTRSESLYRLSYPDLLSCHTTKNVTDDLIFWSL